MADNITAPATGVILATKDIGGVQFPRNLLTTADGVDVADGNPLPVAIVSGGGGGGDATAALQTAGNAILANILAATDGLEALIAATNAAIAGATYYPVTQPVSGTVGVSGSVAVTGPLTDAQLRAAAVPMSAAALPLPAGAATETTLAALLAKIIAAPATAAKQDSIIAALALLAPASGAIAVTPSDSTTLSGVRALKIGTAGNVVATIGGSDFTFVCAAGERLDIQATKVKAATTATGIVALT